MKKKLLAGLATGIFLIGMAGAASGNLLTNGDFSSGFDGWKTLNGDDFTIIPGWGSYTNHVAFLNGGSGQDGRLIQQFDIPLYASGLHVSFDWRGNFGESGNGDPNDPGIDPSSFFSSLVNVDLDDQGLYKYSNSELILNTNESTGWTSVDMTFLFGGDVTDSTPNGRIKFTWKEDVDWISMARLDNVVVGTVPEPATMLLLGTGLVGLAGVSVRRRKK